MTKTEKVSKSKKVKTTKVAKVEVAPVTELKEFKNNKTQRLVFAGMGKDSMLFRGYEGEITFLNDLEVVKPEGKTVKHYASGHRVCEMIEIDTKGNYRRPTAPDSMLAESGVKFLYGSVKLLKEKGFTISAEPKADAKVKLLRTSTKQEVEGLLIFEDNHYISILLPNGKTFVGEFKLNNNNSHCHVQKIKG